MKIVLDTNVLVSALLSPQGLPSKILGLVLNGTLKLLYDNTILAEYTDVLNREKLNIDKELINSIIDFIKSEGEYIIAEPQKIKFDDEDDKIFYEIYKSGEANYLITGNKRHFPKEEKITMPGEFIELNYG
jgi:putative PIN family toxin of toxin-antitoxin system